MDVDYDVKRAHEYIDALAAKVKAAEEKAKRASFDFIGAKIMGFEAYKMPSESFSMNDPDAAQKRADELYEHDKAVRERNKVAADNNCEIKEALILLMKNIGFAETVRQRRKSRARYVQYESVNAQWKDYLDLIPFDVTANRIDEIYKEWCRRIADRRKEIAAQHEATKKKLEASERERSKLKLLASMSIKYGQDFDDVYGAVQHILSKDKYLHLAYYMQKNRGDWTEGCSYAETGLEGFTVEGGPDGEIYKEISELCSDWDGDGRVFRDCTWSYDKIFGLADQGKLKDLTALMEYESNY